MFKFKPIRRNLHIQLMLERPILQWQMLPGRFFEMIFDAQKEKFAVSPSDFSVNHAFVGSELRAKYSIFSGASAVTLHADKLAFDFPGLVPSENPTALEIIGGVHDAFPRAFPEAPYNRIEVQSLEHLEVLGGVTPADVLSRFCIPDAAKAFGGSAVIVQPSARCDIIAEDQTWQCQVVLERSLLNAAAVFAVVTISLRKFDLALPFLDKAAVLQQLGRNCLAAVGLEQDDAISS